MGLGQREFRPTRILWSCNHIPRKASSTSIFPTTSARENIRPFLWKAYWVRGNTTWHSADVARPASGAWDARRCFWSFPRPASAYGWRILSEQLVCCLGSCPELLLNRVSRGCLKLNTNVEKRCVDRETIRARKWSADSFRRSLWKYALQPDIRIHDLMTHRHFFSNFN